MAQFGKKTKKVVQTQETVLANYDTGEIHKVDKTNIYNLPSEPPFIKIYLEDIARILDLPHGPQTVLIALIRKLDYEGMISITPSARERIAKSLNIKVVTLNNYLTTLVDSEVLRRVGRGEYEVNPNLMSKGDWVETQKRRSNFKLTITYQPDGTRTISGALDRSQDAPDQNPQTELPLNYAPHLQAAE